MVNAEAFRNAINQILDDSQNKGLSFIDIRAGDLHMALGDYPGPKARMPSCCSVMRSLRGTEDNIISTPLKGNGANLVIRYYLPRKKTTIKKNNYEQLEARIPREDWFTIKFLGLSARCPDISDLENLEQLTRVDPQSAVIKIRIVAEKISQRICEKQNLSSKNIKFDDLCFIISDHQILSKKAMNYFHSIRKMGNVFAHPLDSNDEKITEADVMILTQALFAIVEECLDKKMI